MKVRCKYNTIDDIVDQNIRNKLLQDKVDGINLEKNKEYNVYGLTVFKGQMYFLIFPYDDLFIPYTYLTYFFEVIDPRMSKYFRFYSSFDSHEINSNKVIPFGGQYAMNISIHRGRLSHGKEESS